AIAAVEAAGHGRQGAGHGRKGARQPEPGRPIAIELGCGSGIEARHLAENGFTVHAYDVDPSVAPVLAELAAVLPVHPEIRDLTEVEALPGANLILGCASLPFVRRDAFDRLWAAMREALRAQGVLAVDLFGEHDDWAETDSTYLPGTRSARCSRGTRCSSRRRRSATADPSAARSTGTRSASWPGGSDAAPAGAHSFPAALSAR